MPEKEITDILRNNVPIPAEELPRLFDMLQKCRKESEITQREAKKYDSIKEVMIQEITGKYAFYEFLFSKIFAERAEAIKKDFEIIDRGMKLNKRDLVATGVSGLSQIVASSPIADVEKLKYLIDKP